MALDMSSGGRDGWLGFSPAAVLVAVVAVLGAGVAVAKSGGDPYVDGITKLCADHEQLQATTDRSDIWATVIRLSELRSQHLRALQPDASRTQAHAELVAGERRVVEVAQPGLVWRAAYMSGARSAPGAAADHLTVVVDELKVQDARYTALGAPAGCAD